MSIFSVAVPATIKKLKKKKSGRGCCCFVGRTTEVKATYENTHVACDGRHLTSDGVFKI